MNFSLLTTLALALAMTLASTPAWAGPTGLASLPLMSITGSGTVKPNLMLLYDDSGSMAWNHTPDYVDDNTTCRASTTLAARNPRGCVIGDPPYAAPLFNRQYYDPKVRYQPPVRADQTSYPSQTSSQTDGWKSVTTDGFGIDKRNMRNANEETTNLLTGYPDLQWCNSDGECRRNIGGYAYPSLTYNSAEAVGANPYYYTINVAEYCTDASLKRCVSTAVNAPAPQGYPVPAPVRWCNSTALTDCQAKYVGNYKYPRYGDPNRSANWYSTITINDSGAASAVSITAVRAVGVSGTQTITRDAATASGGTNTAAKRTALATALAASIVNKAVSDRPFTACVPQASGVVRACSDFGITLESSDMLAVIPISCGRNVTNKNNCTVVREGERTGDEIVVDSGTAATALLQVGGRAANSSNTNGRSRLVGLKLGNTTLIDSLRFGQNYTAAQVASQIAGEIGTRGTIKAYVGPNSVTPQCAAATSSMVCIVAPLSMAGANLSYTRVDNPASLSWGGAPATSDGAPTSVSGFDTGVFIRTDIVPARDNYPKSAQRTDCQGAACTYAEEMTNFANWYAYYKTRNQMMKTSVGLAFQPLGEAYKVGLVGLQDAAAEGTMSRPKPFTGQNRIDWYDALYAMNSAGGTPVRLALHAIGKMFANQAPYRQEAGSETVEYACQQNFTFVTTDGYWNGNSPKTLVKAATRNSPAEYEETVVNNDNTVNPARFCTREKGCLDTRAQTLPSLADVALYWYNGGSSTGTVSLRPEIDDMSKTGQVPGAGNNHLHMRTYALGLGVDGIMTYEPDYDTKPVVGGDFYNLINGVQTGCPWNNNGAYVWPDPNTGTTDLSTALQSRVDDLWHAAINGGGKYFPASDPLQVVDSLNRVLNDIQVATGAAAAAATSTPNVAQEDRDIFSATFTTVKWTGNLSKRVIDIVTGEVSQDVDWKTSWSMGQKVGADADTRSIWWRNPATGARADFAYDQLGADQAWFSNKCSALPQCARLSADQRAVVNDGRTIVGWLRGQQQHADNVLLRAYTTTGPEDTGPNGAQLEILGDVASSKPAYLREPRKAYGSADYAAFRSENASRDPVVFIAANDGMLHAFDAEKGTELWAYMPRITMKKLYRQASVNYASSHQFSTDGSPELADVKIGGEWRTVLVAGLNAGGRGYYALDVTDPADPKPLWEICADSTVCGGVHHQPDMGFTFGNPQFGTIRVGGAERWVVFLTSGYNNIPGADDIQSGSGKGYLFVIDVATGEAIANLGAGDVLDKGMLTTGSGDATTPSGLAKITAITANPNTDPLVTYVYGGDNQGQMWRFDFTGERVQRLLMADAGPDQPITTRPDVAVCQVGSTGEGADASPTRRVVAFGTGRMLDLPDIQNTKVQSAYVLKDDGAAFDAAAWRDDETYAERTLTETRPYDDAAPDVPRSNQFTIGGTIADLGRQRGWFVDFDKNAGERVNLDPKIVAGTLTVVSNLPQSSTACAVGGISYAYFVDVCSGAAVSNDIAGVLLSGDAAAVGTTIVRLPSGALKLITTTAKGNTITTEVAPAKTQDARRTGWRRVRD
ncbi:pilus assembly protein [Massilia timonae]|uniref:pilus assembly protein n=1 Tax=Massilia timonae TaxID=47229 RepID=UPI002355C5A3|nr:PilC/PilY family type IV pilus protein [Massilia timonae]